MFLALLSVVAGGVIGYADPRPKLIKQLTEVHDEEAKAIALRAKTDAGWCTVGMACFGVPAILARIYPPAALKETLINEPVVRITDEAGCNFQIDVGI
ncbi:hypothetical protein A8E16_04130 [Burkholderia cenocepacia]|nr:hypothetical protein A8E13_03395 [Burkholderia cenocepacia]ONR45003.1 hypothetical protein A8E11_02545 [Burkholderia cenocepacia]ONR57559.1 hypothetical protein A8E16_04130 [Burkholderia cenocepacia]